jgi:hypothetical protein
VLIALVQIVYNEERQRLQQAGKADERAAAEAAEAAYQARVQQAAQYTPPTYFGRPKVEWYH